MCIVVDPNFREQFTCTSMPASSVYAQTVANNVPQFFVGTIGTINALVCLLQSTLAEEAQALGLELPPWRSRSALLSKWLPRRFTDSVFMPPALEANLHPLLKSSLAAGGCQQHGTASPTGVQSWQSSQRPSLASSHASSSSSGRCSSAGAGASASGERASPSRTLQPQTVVVGFSVDASSAPSFSSAPSSTSSSCSNVSSPRVSKPRCSALSQQLAAAAEAARSVQAAAADQWARLELLAAAAQQQQRPAAPGPVLALAVVSAPAQDLAPQHAQQAAKPPAFRSPGAAQQQAQEPAAQPQQQGPQPGVASAQQQGPDPSVAAAPQQAPLRLQQQDDALAKLEVVRSNSGGGGGGLAGQLLQASVVSPLHRRAVGPISGGGGGSLRRSGAAASGGCASLKLGGALLKQLPRIYTVKLAVAAC